MAPPQSEQLTSPEVSIRATPDDLLFIGVYGGTNCYLLVSNTQTKSTPHHSRMIWVLLIMIGRSNASLPLEMMRFHKSKHIFMILIC